MQVSSSLGCLVIAVEEMKFCTAARSILRSLLDGISLDNILLPLLTAKAFRPLRTIRPGRGFFSERSDCSAEEGIHKLLLDGISLARFVGTK